MAAVDKLYGNAEQYDELFSWLMENHPDYCRHMYARPKEELENMPLSNFPIEVDGVLYLTCPLAWVKDRIADQYGVA